MITAIGGIMVPLCLVFYKRPWVLLALIFYYSVFSAAAVVAIGGSGVTPGLFPAALFILAFAVSIFSAVRFPGERQVLILLMPFILVVTGALLSSIIMPRLFFGEVLVWPQKMTMLFVQSPLAPNGGNYTQDMYLACDALVTVTAAVYLTRPDANMGRLLDCYLSASFIADGVALWQFCGNTLHVWYPTTFFLSNPGWAQLSDESVGSMIRLNGPFSEPSSLSAYLSAAVCSAAWLMLKGDKRLMLRFVFWLGLGVILLSTATTGLMTLAGMFVILLLRLIVSGSAKFKKRVLMAAVTLGLMAGIGGMVLPVAAPGLVKQAALVLDSTLDKTQTSSYRDRTTADRDSFHEMLETSGLGVGWGSNRSSSLLPGLCASIGLWGLAGLAWFAGVLALRLHGIARITRDEELTRVISGTTAAILSTLISGVISEPTLSSPDFYLLLAMLVASAARAQIQPARAVGSMAPEFA